MAATYTTKQGQTWDEIALEVYGDEIYADYLMQSNYAELDTLIFSAGTVLNTPDLEQEAGGDMPPWFEDEESGEDDEDPYA